MAEELENNIDVEAEDVEEVDAEFDADHNVEFNAEVDVEVEEVVDALVAGVDELSRPKEYGDHSGPIFLPQPPIELQMGVDLREDFNRRQLEQYAELVVNLARQSSLEDMARPPYATRDLYLKYRLRASRSAPDLRQQYPAHQDRKRRYPFKRVYKKF